MRILIVTQAVDLGDPVLGFFHRWIEEFAVKCERVEVLCLREGAHHLPGNVRVASLGKERGASRAGIIRNFYRAIWSARSEYDAVFVHMNSEYVVLGGLLWRFLGKRVVLWRNHPMGGLSIRLAALLSHVLCYTSPRAYIARYKKAVQMPVGIDIAQYQAARTGVPGTLLWLGRIDPIKRFHLVVAALQLLVEDSVAFTFDVYGEPTRGREKYLADVRQQFRALEERGYVRYQGSVTHEKTPAIYAAHDVFVNLTPAGSFDKTIFEAMSAGCLVVISNPDLKDVISADLFVQSEHVESIAMALKQALLAGDAERERERATLAAYVQKDHSLQELVSKAIGLLADA